MATTQIKDLIKETLASIPWQTALQPTLPADRVSYVLHEPAILAGYRVPEKPWTYYFYSVFQLHNETVNVWTHLIGSLIILYKLYWYFDEFDIAEDYVLTTLFVFGICSIMGLSTSSIVHLLHSKSPYVHFVAFMYDYVGATFCSFGAGIVGFYGSSDPATYKLLDGYYLPLLVIVSYANFVNLCLAKIWYGNDPHNMKRKYMFIGGMAVQAVMAMVPFVPRYFTCYHDVTCSMSSTNYLTVVTFVHCMEAVTFAAHQPERTWPGKFDIIGHGHQIFHVLLVVNHVFQLDAIYLFSKEGTLEHSKPNVSVICSLMVFMYIAEVVTLLYFIRFVPGCLKRVNGQDQSKLHAQ